MPVILHKYDYEKWLNPDTSAAELKHLMKPIRNEEIMAHSLTQIPPDKLKS
jgi:putative SOS response-associated peptidase YedK